MGKPICCQKARQKGQQIETQSAFTSCELPALHCWNPSTGVALGFVRYGALTIPRRSFHYAERSDNRGSLSRMQLKPSFVSNFNGESGCTSDAGIPAVSAPSHQMKCVTNPPSVSPPRLLSPAH